MRRRWPSPAKQAIYMGQHEDLDTMLRSEVEGQMRCFASGTAKKACERLGEACGAIYRALRSFSSFAFRVSASGR
jgi:hypothetical protein